MVNLTRRLFLRHAVPIVAVAAPAVVLTPSLLMPLRGVVLPPDQMPAMANVSPPSLALHFDVAFAHQWGRVKKLVLHNGDAHYFVDGQPATREQYDVAKWDGALPLPPDAVRKISWSRA